MCEPKDKDEAKGLELTDERKEEYIKDGMAEFGITRRQHEILTVVMCTPARLHPSSLRRLLLSATEDSGFSFEAIPRIIVDWLADREVKDD